MIYFYDQQIRRYLLQFIRIFADLQIESGKDSNGFSTLSRVPIRYADMNRMVGHIIRENSENTVFPVPMMSAWIQNITLAPDRRNDPMFVSKISAEERKLNQSGEYGADVGNRYTVDRYMPVPYDVHFQLDIWSNNTTTKLQLFEQILTIFNPSIQLQQNSNPLDWSTITEIELTDVIWSSRGIPQGTDTEIDTGSLIFKVPVWINPPAKVKRNKLINQIVTSIYDVANLSDQEIDGRVLDPLRNCFSELDQVIISPGNYRISLGLGNGPDNEVTLLTAYGVEDPTLSWEDLFLQYGNFSSGSSVLQLKTQGDIESDEGDVLGTVVLHPTAKNKLIFTLDQDTLPPTIPSGSINKIIDPLVVYPGNNLPIASSGTRYLIVNSIPFNSGSSPWGSVSSAKENDIIEYNGSNWVVSFDSSTANADQHVTNLANGQQYKFNGDSWIHSYFGEFFPGYWRIQL